MNGEEKKLAKEHFELWRKMHDKSAEEVRNILKSQSKTLSEIKESIAEMKTKISNNKEGNSKDIDTLFRLAGETKCDEFGEKIDWLQRSTNALWSVIIISGIVGLSLWGARGWLF